MAVSRKGRIGILGGRFDPPHVGHVGLAKGGIGHFGIDCLYVTVVAAAGHKPSAASAEDRLAMTRLAFAELDAVVELELHSYTVDALAARRYDDPIFLIGADQLASLSTWKEPERVLELARLGVATRPGYVPKRSSDRIEVFELQPHDVSSTDIRERVRCGAPIVGLVAPAVAAYIADNDLYRADRRRALRLH